MAQLEITRCGIHTTERIFLEKTTLVVFAKGRTSTPQANVRAQVVFWGADTLETRTQRMPRNSVRPIIDWIR